MWEELGEGWTLGRLRYAPVDGSGTAQTTHRTLYPWDNASVVLVPGNHLGRKGLLLGLEGQRLGSIGG